MKKTIVTICLLLALMMVFTTIAMAEEDRAGAIIVKAGVIIPTNDEFDTLSTTGWTLEGEYVFYSTEYIDFAGIFGYWRTGLPNALYQNQSAHIDTIYYMAGAKFYPTKEKFYIGAFVGGASNWVSPDPAPNYDSSNSAFAMKGSVGYEINEHFIVEASYIGQFNEDLTTTINNSSQLTIPGPQAIFQSNSGIQLMGGYKF